MKLTTHQIDFLAHSIIDVWKTNHMIEFKTDESKVLLRAKELIQQNIQAEMALDAEVNRMLDQLERSHGGEFQRFKMFPMVKQKLAKEKGIIL